MLSCILLGHFAMFAGNQSLCNQLRFKITFERLFTTAACKWGFQMHLKTQQEDSFRDNRHFIFVCVQIHKAL